MGALAKLAITGLLALVEWACNGPPGQSDGGEDVNGADGGTDVGGGQDVGDAGDAGEELPEREGIEERWAEFDGQIVDLNLADQKLYALLQGSPNRLISCDLASENLEDAFCEDFVVFREKPLSHSVLDNRYSAISYTDVTEKYLGIFIVDRTFRSIKGGRLFDPLPIQTGQGIIEARVRSLSQAVLFGSFLLVGAESCYIRVADPEGPKPDCTGWAGTILKPYWDDLGTFSYDWGVLDPLHASQKPTLLWEKGANKTLALNVGYPTDLIQASFDTIELDANGHPTIDYSKNFPVSELTVEPLKHLPVSPDNSQVLLATGHDLILVNTENGLRVDSLPPWTGVEGKIVDIQWYSADMAFVADSASKIYRVGNLNGNVVSISSPLTVFGIPTVSAIDLGACIYYPALSLPNNRSAITAIRCDVLTNL